MSKNIFKGFTLAEIMVSLVVIGVLGGVLIPVMMKSKPNNNVLRFKKAHETLIEAIGQLVRSDKYLAGDLGIRPDGTYIDGTNNDDYSYFCKTLADVLNTKSANCTSATTSQNGGFYDTTIPEEYLVRYDNHCKKAYFNSNNRIETTDGILYFEANPRMPFGGFAYDIKLEDGWELWTKDALDQLEAEGWDQHYRLFKDPLIYKEFCIDIDGVPDDATEDDCKNECPFGFGIRADGKIMLGPRAAEWIEKNLDDN